MSDHVLPASIGSYAPLLRRLASPDVHQADKDALFRYTAERDFWFFCRYCTDARNFFCEMEGCEFQGRPMFEHPYVFDMCREIQADPDGYLRLRPRAHLKTTIGTVYLTIWSFLPIYGRPDEIVAIITWVMEDVGESFVDGIQQQLEPGELPAHSLLQRPEDAPPMRRNEILAYHWPEIFYQDPQKEAPRGHWKKSHLCLKSHPGVREASIGMFGLGGIRTGKHYGILNYDDIVTRESSSTPDSCLDCTRKFQATGPLQSSARGTKIRAWGTRWALNDTYQWIIDQGILKVKEEYHDCYSPHVFGETPVSLLHPGSEWLDRWRVTLGQDLFAANMRNRPLDESSVWHLNPDWLRHSYYDGTPDEVADDANLYAFVDPAKLSGTGPKRKDYTAIVVLALRADARRYVVEMIRDRMEVADMVEIVFKIDDYWRGRGNPIKIWWWESRGASLDVEFWHTQAELRKNAAITFLPFQSIEKKDSRIGRLKWPFQKGLIRFPRQSGAISRVTDGAVRDMVSVFIQEEYTRWTPSFGTPYRPNVGARNEDLLDALAQSESPAVQKHLVYPATKQEKTWEAVALEQDIKRQQRFRKGGPPGSRDPWAC